MWRAAKNTGKKKTRLFSLARALLSFQSSHLGGLRLERLASLVGLAGLLDVDLFLIGGGVTMKKKKQVRKTCVTSDEKYREEKKHVSSLARAALF